MNGLTFFPNPANDLLSIASISKMQAVKIYDTRGKLVSQTDIDSNEIAVDITGFRAGIYFCEVICDKAQPSQWNKICITH